MISCVLCSRYRPNLKNIYQINYLLNREPIYKIQVLSSNMFCNKVEEAIKQAAPLNESTKFTEFYRFPYIRMGFFLHKLKWYQTGATCVAIPASLLLYWIGLIDSSWVIGVTVPGLMLTSNLHASSFLIKNAIGFMYLSEDEETFKVSYLDIWGNRIDEEILVQDVMPFLDAPRPPTDILYKQIEFLSSDKRKLKLFLKLGKITDKDKFLKVFGPLD